MNIKQRGPLRMHGYAKGTLCNVQQHDVLDDFVPLLEGLIRFF